ncbi:MAG: type II toxin-antitoxin system VapC family toxin [Mycobacteriales bacterium]
MTFFYADTSAVIGVYFVDEPEHDRLRRLLLESDAPTVSSELTRVEFASAVAAAHRNRRVGDPGTVLDRFDADCGGSGVFTLLRLDPAIALPRARTLVLDHRLRTLDAIHLAVALTGATTLAAGEPITFVTCDQQQGAAAIACGLTVV